MIPSRGCSLSYIVFFIPKIRDHSYKLCSFSLNSSEKMFIYSYHFRPMKFCLILFKLYLDLLIIGTISKAMRDAIELTHGCKITHSATSLAYRLAKPLSRSSSWPNPRNRFSKSLLTNFTVDTMLMYFQPKSLGSNRFFPDCCCAFPSSNCV